MTCRHDLTVSDDAYWTLPECRVHVDCDQGCKAPTEPTTVDELRAAVVHWREHGWLYGCSHGR